MTATSRRILATLPRLRREAEALMVDECVVKRATGETELVDYEPVPVYETLYEGRCKIGGDRPHETPVIVGAAASVIVQRHIVHLPVAAGPFDDGDVVTITAALTQPHLVGNVYRIAGADERSLQTSQRMYVDILGGGA